MNFTKYQEEAIKTAQFPSVTVTRNPINFDIDVTMDLLTTDKVSIEPNGGLRFVYPALGLCGEAGEVAEKIKKIIRNKRGIWDENDRLALIDELGDVLWYLSALCDSFNIDLDYVATRNIAKLSDRAKRNVIKSEGDNR